MAPTARAPQYGVKKSKKPRKVGQVLKPVPTATINRPKKKPVRGTKWGTPAATNTVGQPMTPTPVQPEISSVPEPITPVAPPTSVGTDNTRIDAREVYGGTVAGVNTQLRELARQYGLAPSVTQFGYTPEGGDTQFEAASVMRDPLSTASTVDKNWAAQSGASGMNANLENTFFSGLQQADQSSLKSNRNLALEDARRKYDEAVRTLIQMIMDARGTRDDALRDANQADVDASLDVEPEAEAEAPPAAAAPSSSEAADAKPTASEKKQLSKRPGIPKKKDVDYMGDPKKKKKPKTKKKGKR